MSRSTTRRAFAMGAVASLVFCPRLAKADILDFDFPDVLDEFIASASELADGGMDGNIGPQSLQAIEKLVDAKCGPGSMCKETAHEAIEAAKLWRQVMAAQGQDVPDYIDTEYVIRCAGIESLMNRFAHRKNSCFEGLMQYDRLDPKKTFWEFASSLVGFFNNDLVRSQIRLVKKLPSIQAHHFKERDIFLNTHVQVSALMFEALKLSKNIENDPNLQTLPPNYKRAWLYLYHNLPRAAWIVANGWKENIPIRELAMKATPPALFGKYYQANSFIYQKDGDATPAQILSNVVALTQIFYDRFHPGGHIYDAPSSPVAIIRANLVARPLR